MSDRWRDIWSARVLDSTAPATLSDLMAADGLDTGFGSVGEQAWSAFVHSIAERLGLGSTSTVFEVGCGAGAFLHPLISLGVEVSGLDFSPTLIDIARNTFPGADLNVAHAHELAATPQVDVVLSMGVFLYFDSTDYAWQVLAQMASKARRAVAILDIPDAATAVESLAHRQAVVGGPEAYAQRYAGLDHLHYKQADVLEAMRAAGLTDVTCEPQSIPGYANSAFRFNAFGWVA